MSCASRFGGNLPSRQPSVKVFRHFECAGTEQSVAPGNYPNANVFNNDSISSIYVPPNQRVTAYQHYNYQGHKHTFGPGFHPRLDPYHMNDNISGMKVTQTESWPNFLLECCLGRRDNSMCKQYAGTHKPACRNILTNYCGSNLSRFRTPQCQSFYSKNRSIADTHAQQLCTQDANKSNAYCACFNAPANIIRPSCFDEKCSTGTAYQTADMKNAATKCGMYCKMQFNTGGAKSVMLENNTFVQQCGDKIQDSKRIDPETGRVEYGPPRAAGQGKQSGGSIFDGGLLGSAGFAARNTDNRTAVLDYQKQQSKDRGDVSSLFGPPMSMEDEPDKPSGPQPGALLAVGGGGSSLSSFSLIFMLIIGYLVYTQMK